MKYLAGTIAILLMVATGFFFSITFAAVNTIDDEDAGWSTVGTWTEYTGGEGIGGDIYYDETGSGSETATWNFGTGTTGSCVVEIHYTTHSNRATDSPYTIKGFTSIVTTPTVSNPIVGVADNIDETGSADPDAITIDINQELDSNGDVGGSDINSGWVNIGEYTFEGGEDGLVVLTDNANEYVIADAVRFDCTAIAPATETSELVVVRDGGITIRNGGIVIRGD